MKSLAVLFPAYLLYLHGNLKSTVSDILGQLEQIIASLNLYNVCIKIYCRSWLILQNSL